MDNTTTKLDAVQKLRRSIEATLASRTTLTPSDWEMGWDQADLAEWRAAQVKELNRLRAIESWFVSAGVEASSLLPETLSWEAWHT